MSSRSEQFSSESMEQQMDLRYESLLAKNKELIMEIVTLKKAKAEMRLENDILYQQNLEAKFKSSEFKQIISHIDERSKICLTNIVACSTQLTQIMHFTKSIMAGKDITDFREFQSPKKSISKSFQQVVPPHAVNGHIIHTPTIRIPRYHEPVAQEENEQINSTEQVNEDEENPQNPNEEIDEEIQENTSFRSMRYDSSKTQSFSSDQGSNENNVLPDNSNSSEETVLDSELPRLEPIQEEFEETDQTISNQSAQESEHYTNGSPSSSLANSSTTVETGDFNGNESIDTPRPQFEENESVTYVRSTFVQRKSIGSPMPSKVSRRNCKRRRSSTTSKLIAPDASTSAKNQEESLTLQQGTTSDSYAKRKRCNFDEGSPPSAHSSQTYNSDCNSNNTSVIESFIENNLKHSTPLCQTKSKGENVNSRRNRLKQPQKELIVKLERFDLSTMSSCSNVTIDTTQSASIASKSRSRRKNSTPKKIMPKVKIEEKTEETTRRPSRAAKPTRPLVESKINVKMRRDF